MNRWMAVPLLLLLVVAAGGAVWVRGLNEYQTEGTLVLSVLDSPVTVTRDERGVAHVAAGNRRDMLRALGFVTAQDRLFQMEYFRMLAQGRLAELVGEDAVPSDIQIRVLGLARNAERMAAQFAPSVQQFFSDYLAGVNAYIATREDEFPLELSLLQHTPEPWSVADSALILQFISLSHSVNMKAEAVLQTLVDAVGAEKASSLVPINVNPDRSPEALPTAIASAGERAIEPGGSLFPARRAAPAFSERLDEALAAMHVGSNNWVVGPGRSASGAAVVVNDPHLDARLLPGVWYPIGMSTPDFHAAGVALPALPGLVVGRTDRVAFGVTNAYGDVQDLFIEQQAPESGTHYLEGDTRVPFERREEVIRVRDKTATAGYREEKIIVRSTRRGPVVSDQGIVDLGARVVSLRWNAATAFGPEIGYDRLLFARSAAEVDAAVQLIDINMFNVVFADVDGNFGRRSSGSVPVRRVGQGLVPVSVTDSGPYWLGWIPSAAMPGEFNPSRGWSGTANHDTRPADYPYTYSTYFAPSYRYRRLAQLLDGNDSVSVDDHWAYMHDVKNLQAAAMAPRLVPLLREAGYAELADSLVAWTHEDRARDRAPLLYQVLYQELARATFGDELGPVLAADFLASWYVWQERFDALVRRGDSIWFDDVATGDRVETLTDVVAAAAGAATARLEALGRDATWGDVHQLTFRSPMRRSGFGSAWLGGGTYPMSGSGETLRRARYAFGKPFETAFFASYNLVSDMGETDEIETALPGGVAARVLHKHYASQIPTWHAEQGTPTPLSRAAAQAAAVSTLTLTPAGS